MLRLNTPAGRGLLALFLVLATPALALASPAERPEPPALDPYQLLTNPSMEVYDPVYGYYEGVPCQVATGWQRYWLGDQEPYWMDGIAYANSHLGTGWVERIDGETCQFLFSTEPYSAGIMQSVAVTPGVGYGFHAALLSIFRQSSEPPQHNTMFKKLGIDPTGGTDPEAGTVLWTEPNGWDKGPWQINERLAAYAQAPVMTVFIQVDSLYASGDPGLRNLSFLDSSILARTPTISAVSPATSLDPTFLVRWDNAQPAPGLVALKWRDAQWLDEAEGVWHDWITGTYEEQATFTGQWGHAYRFRARVWQQYENGAHLYGPYRPGGDTRTAVAGPCLAGRVLSHDGRPVSGARVAVPGALYAARSGANGDYELALEPWSSPEVITVGHGYWSAPPGLHGVTVGLTDTVPFTWTLRPADDAVANGQLEENLDGWHPLGQTPTIVDEPVHTGLGAVALSGPEGVTFTAGLTQTLVLSHTWAPALSFWYNAGETEDEDLFRVSVTLVTEGVSPTLPITYTALVTPALTAPGWVHVSVPISPPDAYAGGTARLRFQFWHRSDDRSLSAALYLDEISLGATAGGPYCAYLPIVLDGRR